MFGLLNEFYTLLRFVVQSYRILGLHWFPVGRLSVGYIICPRDRNLSAKSFEHYFILVLVYVLNIGILSSTMSTALPIGLSACKSVYMPCGYWHACGLVGH